ncbi:MAG: HAMP domain-containing protein [Gemmatimonadota bacterium]
MRLPWAVGVLLFAVLTIAVPATVYAEVRRGGRVPDAVVAQQRSVTENAAQSLRRSVNEGVVDLEELAAMLDLIGRYDYATLREASDRFSDIHARYEAVYIMNTGRTVLASVGGEARPDLLRGDRPFRRADMDDAQLVETDLVIPQYAPVGLCPPPPPGMAIAEPCGNRGAVVGHYRSQFLLDALGGLELGRAWLVNHRGRVLAAPASVGVFEKLPRPELEQAAAAAARGEVGAFRSGSGDAIQVIAFAPASGFGPAGQLGWSVVTVRPVEEFIGARRGAAAIGLGLAISVVTIFVFGWLWIAFIRPLDQLEFDADRIAHGDLESHVDIHRHDEIGLVARSLERIRISAHAMANRDSPNGEETWSARESRDDARREAASDDEAPGPHSASDPDATDDALAPSSRPREP